MNVQEQNKRKFERFDLNCNATIETGEKETKLKLYTRDISAGGAFFQTAQSFEPGMKVRLEIIIENATIKKLTGIINSAE